MVLALLFLLEGLPQLWQPPFAYGSVRLARVEGRTLCVPNADGTALLVDGPLGSGWEWYEYEAGGGWFAARRTSEGAEFEQGVDFARIWGQPTCERLGAHSGPGAHLDSCEVTEIPEPGTLRVVSTRRMQSVWLQTVSYYTPHGYHFGGALKDGVEDPRDISMLASYRIVANLQCGPVPEHPRKRRTTSG
jgi:hypothetical protein